MSCHNFIKYFSSITYNALQAFRLTVPLAKLQSYIRGRASSYASLRGNRQKGSLTVEAAVVLPLFFLGMVSLICIMDMLRIQAKTSIALNESVKELGMYAYVTEKTPADIPVGQVTQAICIAYAQSQLPDEPNADIHMRNSTYQDHVIELCASGIYKIPVAIVPVSRIYFQNRVKVHDWTGYHGGYDGSKADDTEMVYITDRKTVYHTYSDCTHMEVSAEQVLFTKVGDRRNLNGGKYYPCPHCVSAASHSVCVYIARSGDRYHSNPNCQSLKRSVHMVMRSEAENMNECARCRQRRESD